LSVAAAVGAVVAAAGAAVGWGAVVGVAQPIISAPIVTNNETITNARTVRCFFIEPSLTVKTKISNACR
jgi:hypothetical protein